MASPHIPAPPPTRHSGDGKRRLGRSSLDISLDPTLYQQKSFSDQSLGSSASNTETTGVSESSIVSPTLQQIASPTREQIETLHEEGEEEEEEDFLEFRLKQEYDGIFRYSQTEDKDAPQMIRYSRKSALDSNVELTSPISPIRHGSASSFNKTANASIASVSISSDKNSRGFVAETVSPSLNPKQVGEPFKGSSTSSNSHSNSHSHSNSQSTHSSAHNTAYHRTQPSDEHQPSEFSHLELQQHNPLGDFPALGKSEESDHENDDEEDGWQEMKTVGAYNVYDDKNNVVVHKQDSVMEAKEDLSHIQAVNGYTRVTRDEDARSITSMDEETNYLFDEDELSRNPLSQLEATKDMLTDAQRIAYVGLCRLIMMDQATELAHVRVSRKTSKRLSNAQGSMAMWTQKMMMRLYRHMDLNQEEQIMIEQLSAHGVLPTDLSPSLIKVATVKNPFQTKNSGYEHEGDIGDDETLAVDSTPLEGVPDVHGPETIEDRDKLEIDIRWTLLCDLFLVLISDSIYDARSRTLLERAGRALDITSLEIAQFEKKVTDALEIEESSEQQWDESEIMEQRRKKALRKKYMYVGLATLGGGLVIGLSAGLLAPVIGAGIAAGFTTIGITGTSGFLAGAGGAAVVTSTGAAIGARIGQSGMARRMGHVKTFEFRPLHNNKRVNAIVTVSGWMSGKEDDVRLPFSTVDPIMGDLFSVLWEPEMLQSMGQTINILATEALTQTVQQVLGQTLLVALMASIQLPMALSKLGYLLDNPWSVSLDRAWSAGLILADSLIQRSLGVRPVTLVGFSLGARVIYSCLVELARRGAFGLVQDVYIFGAPVVVKRDQFALCRSVVSGRFVNGFSRKDWILGYLFRATSGGLGRIAGLAKIEGFDGMMENLDCTDIIEGHMGYRKGLPKLLAEVGWEVLSEEFAEIEDPDPEQHRERQRKLIKEFDDAKKQMEEEAAKKKKKSFFSWMKPKKKEWWEMAEAADQDASADSHAEASAEPSTDTGSVLVFDLDAIEKELFYLEREGLDKNVSLPSTLPRTDGRDRSASFASTAGNSDTSTAFGDEFGDDYQERGAAKSKVVEDEIFSPKIGPSGRQVVEEYPSKMSETEEKRKPSVTERSKPKEVVVGDINETEESVKNDTMKETGNEASVAEENQHKSALKESPPPIIAEYDDEGDLGAGENVTMTFFE